MVPLVETSSTRSVPGPALDDGVLARDEIAVEAQRALRVPPDRERAVRRIELRPLRPASDWTTTCKCMAGRPFVTVGYFADGGVFGNVSTYSISPEYSLYVPMALLMSSSALFGTVSTTLGTMKTAPSISCFVLRVRREEDAE